MSPTDCTQPGWWWVLHIASWGTAQFKHMLELYFSGSNLLVAKGDKTLYKNRSRVKSEAACPSEHWLHILIHPKTGFPLPLTWWRGKKESEPQQTGECLTAYEIRHCWVHGSHTPSVQNEMSHCHYLSPIFVSPKKLFLLTFDLSILAVIVSKVQLTFHRFCSDIFKKK